MGHVQVFLGQEERAQAGGISTVGLTSQMLDLGGKGDAEMKGRIPGRKERLAPPPQSRCKSPYNYC